MPTPPSHPSHDTLTRDASIEGHGEDAFTVLLLVVSERKSLAVDFGAQSVLTVGRGEGASVRLSDRSLSRLHARFRRDGDTVTVLDLGSRNGVVQGGRRVTEVVLRPTEAVALGNVTVSVQVAPRAQAAMMRLESHSSIAKRMDEEWTRSRGFRRPFAILYVCSGERARAATFVADCVSHLRSMDHVGLYDPYSLLVLLPEATTATAEAMARTLTQTEGGKRLLCGVAAYPESGFTPEQLVSAAVDAGKSSGGQAVRTAPRAPHVRVPTAHEAVCPSAPMAELDRIVSRLARGKIPVLVFGETGSGKEIVARQLHERSPRHLGPLRVVNCATIPENLIESVLFGHEKGAFTGADRAHPGVFEQGDGGTVFLDEVAELSGGAQAALLRALDTGRVCRIGSTKETAVDVRVVAATHRDLPAMIQRGEFRMDLFHRLNAFTLTVPPLRERRDDIVPLAEHFADRAAIEWGVAGLAFADDALECLLAYEWPGNVRELRNVIQHALTLAEGDRITSGDLPVHIRDAGDGEKPRDARPTPSPSTLLPAGGIDLRTEVQEHEESLIRRALEMSGGSQRRAADLLSLPLRTFQRKLRRASGQRDDDPEE